MKQYASWIVISPVVLIFTIISCKKDEEYMSDAEIIGWDVKMCPCCGGLEITIDNIPNPVANTYYLVNQLPSNFSIGDNPKFPIAVKIDWKIDSIHCGGTHFDITRIARR
jgi:hypothetical protein